MSKEMINLKLDMCSKCLSKRSCALTPKIDCLYFTEPLKEKPLVGKYRAHNCNKMRYKGQIEIRTLPITHTSWVMKIPKFGITIHDIKYCPYCGIKLE